MLPNYDAVGGNLQLIYMQCTHTYMHRFDSLAELRRIECSTWRIRNANQSVYYVYDSLTCVRVQANSGSCYLLLLLLPLPFWLLATKY